jgi:eukaryotic-like serine/threonine-protein kinase
VRGELAQLQMLLEIGRGDEALARMDELAPRVSTIDYPPLSANAAYLRAQLVMATGDLPGAKAAMVEAAQIATAAQFDPLAAQAWVDLVYVAAEPMRDFERAHEYDGNARAAIARMGDGIPRDQLESRRAGHFGRLLVREGDVAGGRRELEHSLALAESLAAAQGDRTSHEFVADALEAIAFADGVSGDLAESIATYERVLARRIELLGPEHPRTAMTYADLGGALADAGRLAPALEHNRTARELYERVLGPDDPSTAIALGNEARLLGWLDRHDEAIAAYDRALAIAERTEGADGYLATRTRDNRARVLVAAGRPRDAIPELERALARYESGELGLDRADVAHCLLALGEAWLAAGEPARAQPLLSRGLAEPGLDPLLVTRLQLSAGLAAAGTARARAR